MSLDRYSDHDRRQRYSIELGNIANDIRSGKGFPYDTQEIDKLLAEKKVIDNVSSVDVARIVIRIFLPAVIFISLSVLILVALRFLK
jgi:hypothetical protein